MSSNNYLTPYYYHPPPMYTPVTTWDYSAWSAATQNQAQSVDTRSAQTASLAPPPPPPPLPYTPAIHNPAPPPPPPPISTASVDQRPQTYYSSSQPEGYRTRRYINNAQYSGTGGHYSVSAGQYQSNQYNSAAIRYNNMMSSPKGYIRNYYGKRKSESELDVSKKSSKKRKKPLSQNIPQRKDWSVNDAIRALTVEKEYNKRHKSQSLIIKFPDLELNRDIVAKFHPSIESVHFQQPSTPRFCFVTLKDVADPEVVIKDLNKTKYGNGYLTAEFKKDREDEINIGPEDIDPLTLYVGNLAQEVTKEDMVNTYPRQKRIDIGYAKKMKYTRYAFVSFKYVDDSIQAFKKTHATQMYSKSLIVRFRRLNGTVGMPGEPKPQMPQRNGPGEHPSSSPIHLNDSLDVDHHPASDVEIESSVSAAPWEMVDVSNWETDTEKSVDFIKQELPEDSDDDYEIEQKPPKRDYLSPFLPGSLEVAFSLHKPLVKTEIKIEKPEEDNTVSSSVEDENDYMSPLPTTLQQSSHSEHIGSKEKGVEVLSQTKSLVDFKERNVEDLGQTQRHVDFKVKGVKDLSRSQRPVGLKARDVEDLCHTQESQNDLDADCLILPPDKIKTETVPSDNKSTYNLLRSLNKNTKSIDYSQVEVKSEAPSPIIDEGSNSEDAGEPAKVKSEPDSEDEKNDGDEDDSSDDSDDFTFNTMLSSIEDRSRRLKQLKKSVL